MRMDVKRSIRLPIRQSLQKGLARGEGAKKKSKTKPREEKTLQLVSVTERTAAILSDHDTKTDAPLASVAIVNVRNI